ncbi:MAG: tRNA (adenosine(37)-N6)-threonylcarbamoyltransferase complex dimerization subunit type 1 TsaB [Clostridia bacterium]|nr:tRNA (adenosine(37)-N6)-threonylcarbamoyltransferase complex dimerization subunit type 1 TsaB [Clostridia bacterium]
MSINYLAVDTSGFHLTVIARGDRGEYTYYNENCNLKHSVTLMGAVEESLFKANLKKEEVDVFCCCIGPGSFTGIRIGVATVKALGYALDKKVLGVTSFDALAYYNTAEDTLALIDARHGHVYSAGYSGGKVIIPPAYTAVEDLERYRGKYKFASPFKIDGVETEIIPPAEGFRRAVEAKLSLSSKDAETLLPLYIRKSQAEEGR